MQWPKPVFPVLEIWFLAFEHCFGFRHPDLRAKGLHQDFLQDAERELTFRLLKNVQIQGARNPEE